jgi:hypothetical protein
METGDLDDSLAHLLEVVRPRAVEGVDWEAPADGLAWSCWETVEHLADTLFVYSLQFTPRPPEPETGRHGYLPVSELKMEREHGPLMLLHLLAACGDLLSRAIRSAGPGRRMPHFTLLTDPDGFAAMGTVESLAHGWDLTGGLGVRDAFNPPPEVCERALSRLFPEIPPALSADHGPWPALLWAVGRTALPGHPRRETWRWNARGRE